MMGVCGYEFPVSHELPGYNPNRRPDHQCWSDALELIRDAKRPAIYAGGGAVRAGAAAELLEFAQLLNAPVVTTLQARGVIPDSCELSLGMVGMHGTVAAAAALQGCDLLIALGARFSDRVTGALSEFAPFAKVIHADIDPAEIGKNRAVDAPLFGDVKETVRDLVAAIRSDPQLSNSATSGAGASVSKLAATDVYSNTLGSESEENGVHEAQSTKSSTSRAAWWEYLRGIQQTYPLYLDEELAEESARQGRGALSPQFVIKRIGEIAKQHDEDAVFVSGVGQHQMWASQFLGHEKPHNWIQSAGLGTMGYAIPAGMGAKAGRPDSDVWVIDGDGCFQMTNQELATCRLSNFPIKVMLINNGTLGMPRQWQTLLFHKHYSQTDLHDGPDGWDKSVVLGDGEEAGGASNVGVPDFVKLAESYDCLAIRVTRPEEVDEAIERAAAERNRPVVVEFQVAKDAIVFPMVPAGESNNSIIYKVGCQPLKDRKFNEIGGEA
jgi:acetolactate synthase-1/2/3 large subunit